MRKTKSNPFKKSKTHTSLEHILRSGHFRWSFVNTGINNTFNKYSDKFETIQIMTMLVRRYCPHLMETIPLNSKTTSYWENENEMTYNEPNFKTLSKDEQIQLLKSLSKDIEDIIKKETEHERTADINILSKNKIKISIPGNHEMTQIHERIISIGCISNCSVVYDGECRTMVFVELN